MKPGVELLADLPGSGSPVERHGWYDVRLRMWLSRGDPVRWTEPWGLTDGARIEDEGNYTLHDAARGPGVMFAGLFYGVEGMRVGGHKARRKVRAMSEVSVRYMIDDVPGAVRFYTTLLGFAVEQDASPAFASVSRDGVRLLLSGEGSSGKRTLGDGRRQVPGGWNRIHLQVIDLEAEVERLRTAGVQFRTPDIVTGPGGAQVIIEDPSGNPIELFQPRR